MEKNHVNFHIQHVSKHLIKIYSYFRMDKISIASILSLPEEEIVGSFGTCTILSQKKKSVKKEVDDLMRINKERREHKIKLYRTALRDCIRKIKKEDEMRKTDTFFRVDEIVYGHPEYDKEECIEYVIIELKKFLFDVFQYDQSTIFVSWKFTELHKKSQFLTNPDQNIQ